MSQPLRAPAPVVGLVHELIEYAAERHGERPFLLRYASGTWSGYTFMAAARAVRAFAMLLERDGVRPGARVGLTTIAALNRINRGPTRVLTEIPVRILYMILQSFFELMDRVFFDPREVLAHVVVARRPG